LIYIYIVFSFVSVETYNANKMVEITSFMIFHSLFFDIQIQYLWKNESRWFFERSKCSVVFDSSGKNKLKIGFKMHILVYIGLLMYQIRT